MDNKLPLISVILPIYNVEKVLRRSVDSVLAQTYGNIEVILVDDGSPDGCPEICDEYAKKDLRVRVIHQQNGGLSSARNRGIDESMGEFIAFVDSDDYVANDYIEFLYDLLSKNDADVSSCGAAVLNFNGRLNDPYIDKTVRLMSSSEALERMCYNDGFYVTAWDKLYKRELFDDIRFPVGKLYEDTGTIYRIIDKAVRIVSCCNVKYYYVLAEQSITNSAFTEKKLDYIEMADEMANFIKEKYPELKPAAERKQLHACLSTLTQLVNSNTRNCEIEEMLLNRINRLRKSAIKNPRTPKRDKAALVTLSLGYNTFSLIWKLYLKVKKG